ncbi:MAG: hypothetical protein QME60_05365 [Verrucomicrobiota bacterium]|nr:hypothetical protein [Verrucomicrobiota bacterium]
MSDMRMRRIALFVTAEQRTGAGPAPRGSGSVTRRQAVSARAAADRSAGLAVVLALPLLFCAGCGLYSKGTVYEAAKAAVLKNPDFPLNATIGPAADADFYIGKSTACVRVPVQFADFTGARQADTYIVWLDRICIRWEVNRCHRAPKFSTPIQSLL